MGRPPTLLDHRGRPVERRTLREEVSRPTLAGVRQPTTGYPANGLDPERLAALLQAADRGDPVSYLELAEAIEERDPHYLGVLGTRRRSVTQIEVTVEPGDDSALAEEQAERVRSWLRRGELADEVFDILDAIGKGYSFTEIIWDSSMGQWEPQRLEYRDPRWFRFDRADLATPLLLDEGGQELPLPAFKFIYARFRAKSGIPLRSGLARVAAWGWMFKAYTQRDWAIFTQTFGQPLRIGKWGPGASEEDKETLFRAVANIAGDCAAIMPDSMSIEFESPPSIGASIDLYERRADWLDKQISKAVLGQTATTDAETGGLGSGKEHREVQKDIQAADGQALAAILNRDLIRPWMALDYGAQAPAPRVIIQETEKEDLAAFASALAPFIDRGLQVSEREIRARFGLGEPARDDRILSPEGIQTAPADQTSILQRQSAVFQRGSGSPGGVPAEKHLAAVSGPENDPPDDVDLAPAIDRLAAEADPLVAEMVDTLEAMAAKAGSLDELREMIDAAWPQLDTARLAAVLGRALTVARAAGMVAVAEEARDG